MESLRLYRITDKYIWYLKCRDSKVQDNKNKKRPYVGVVLHVGSFQYFVPMESPKPNHAHIKNGKHIMCYSALSVRRKVAKNVKFSATRSSWRKTKNTSKSMRLFHEQVFSLTA